MLTFLQLFELIPHACFSQKVADVRSHIHNKCELLYLPMAPLVSLPPWRSGDSALWYAGIWGQGSQQTQNLTVLSPILLFERLEFPLLIG